MLKMLDLFAGCGGASFAAHQLGIKTKQFVEIDPDAIAVLKNHFPAIPIHHDIQTYVPPRNQFDIVWNSFPCTGTSNAGTRTGLEHPESRLWRHAMRVYVQSGARFLVVEQPGGVADRGLRSILGFLTMAGCQVEIGCFTAKEFGACHDRLRIFILAYPHGGTGEVGATPRDNNPRAATYTRWHYPPGVQSEWLGFCDAPGFPALLVSNDRASHLPPESYLLPKRGRSLAPRKLAGRTVTPAQAAMPLYRILNILEEEKRAA